MQMIYKLHIMITQTNTKEQYFDHRQPIVTNHYKKCKNSHTNFFLTKARYYMITLFSELPLTTMLHTTKLLTESAYILGHYIS